MKNKKHEEPLGDRGYLRRRKIVSICSLMILLAFFAVISITVGKPLLQMVSEPEQFRQWVDERAFWGRLAFIGMMCLQVIVAVIPGEPMEIGAGYAFGPWEGMLLCLAGAAAGSILIYFFARKWGVKMVEAFISREKLQSVRFLQDAKRLNLLVFLIFFIPGTPKDVVTCFIGLTPMRLPAFLLITSIARIPSVLSSTLGGDALGIQDYTLAAVIFACTAAISLGGILYYRRLCRMHQTKEVSSEENMPKTEETASNPQQGLPGSLPLPPIPAENALQPLDLPLPCKEDPPAKIPHERTES